MRTLDGLSAPAKSILKRAESDRKFYAVMRHAERDVLEAAESAEPTPAQKSVLAAWELLLSAYEASLGPAAEAVGVEAMEFRLGEKSEAHQEPSVIEMLADPVEALLKADRGAQYHAYRAGVYRRSAESADAMIAAIERMRDAALERAAEKGEAVACADCGKLFEPKRPNQQYHDANCANRARVRRFRGKAARRETVTV